MDSNNRLNANTARLAEIAKRIPEVRAAMRPMQDEIAHLEAEALALKSQFRVGQVIKWRKYSGRVVAILEWCCGEPMWKVQNIRKDGSEGDTRMVRGYDNPALAEESK